MLGGEGLGQKGLAQAWEKGRLGLERLREKEAWEGEMRGCSLRPDARLDSGLEEVPYGCGSPAAAVQAGMERG